MKIVFLMTSCSETDILPYIHNINCEFSESWYTMLNLCGIYQKKWMYWLYVLYRVPSYSENELSINHLWILYSSLSLCLPDSLRLPQSEARGGAPLASIRRTVHCSHPQLVWEHASREEVPAHHHGVVGFTFHRRPHWFVNPDPIWTLSMTTLYKTECDHLLIRTGRRQYI